MNKPSVPPELETIKARLVALIQAVLLVDNRLENMVKSSDFKSHFKPVIIQLVKQFPALIDPMLATVSEEDIRRVLEMLRDDFIPFLLNEPKPTPQDFTPYHHDEEAPHKMIEGFDPDTIPLIAKTGKEKRLTIEALHEDTPQG